MLINAYSLYDAKSLAYSPPFYAAAHGEAVRMVTDLAADLNTTVGRHPKDFTLYCVGGFDNAAGKLLPADTREHIGDVVSFVPAKPAPLFERGEKPGDYVVTSASANGVSEPLGKARE